MSGIRRYLADFALANPLYAGATVTIYTVDPVLLLPTTTLATLYADLTSQSLLANPQRLDGEGKWQQPIYVDAPVIMNVGGAAVADHQTGITSSGGTYRGDWTAGTLYFTGDTVRDGPAGTNTSNVYYCASPNTSGVFATDLSNGLWTLYISATAIAAGATALAVQTALAAITAQGFFSINNIGTTQPTQSGVVWLNGGPGGVLCVS